MQIFAHVARGQTPLVLHQLVFLKAISSWPYTDYLLRETLPGLYEDGQYSTDEKGNRLYTVDTLHLLPVPLPWHDRNSFLTEKERQHSISAFLMDGAQITGLDDDDEMGDRG